MLARRHDQLSTYGIGKEHSVATWTEIARQLARRGWLAIDSGTYPTVTLTAEGMALLRERRPVSLTRLMANDSPAARPRAGDIECDQELFEILRSHRKQVADAASLPPYVVFSDVSLRHMARSYPTADAAFLAIPGVGERKLIEYSPGFMNAIRDYLQTNARKAFAPLSISSAPLPRPPKPVVNSTAHVSLELWRGGKSVDEIAAERKLTSSTLEGHLASAIANGEALDPRAFYTAAEEKEMRSALDGYTEESLKPIYDHLEGKISYGKLKIFRAFQQRDPQAKLSPV